MSRPSEDAVHVPLLVWMRENIRTRPRMVWHVPNEGRRGIAEQRRQKARGLVAGVGDICFVLDGDGRFGCVEVKREGSTYSSVSDEQRAWGRSVIESGGLWAWVTTKEQGIAQCRAWGIVRPDVSL